MTIQSVSNVSFGAVSKKGNEYKKSHAATITGAAMGAMGATGVALNRNMLKKSFALMADAGAPKFIQTLAKNPKTAIVVWAATSFLVWLGIGAGINKIVNHNKAAKADKAAEAQKAE